MLVVEAGRLTSQDYMLIEMLEGKLDRTFLVLNKIDTVASKTELLPTLEKLASRPFAEFLPVSARTGENSRAARRSRSSRTCPWGRSSSRKGMVTDRDLAFRIAEIDSREAHDARSSRKCRTA